MPNRIEPRVPEVLFEIPVLDDDHRQLVDHVNTLLRTIAAQEPGAAQAALEALRSEAEDHFAREELLMQAAGYPDRRLHSKRHHRLLAELGALRLVLDTSGKLQIPLVPLGFIRRWFRAHTARDDLKFATFIDGQEERFLFGLA